MTILDVVILVFFSTLIVGAISFAIYNVVTESRKRKKMGKTLKSVTKYLKDENNLYEEVLRVTISDSGVFKTETTFSMAEYKENHYGMGLSINQLESHEDLTEKQILIVAMFVKNLKEQEGATTEGEAYL